MNVLVTEGLYDRDYTTLVRVARELSVRGWRVATIKHRHGFTIDHEGRDSWRHRQEGNAIRTAIASDHEFAVMGGWQDDAPLGPVELTRRYFEDADVVRVEGFRTEKLPTIEVFRRAVHNETWYNSPLADRSMYIAMASDSAPVAATFPTFDVNDPALASLLADVIENAVLPAQRARRQHRSMD